MERFQHDGIVMAYEQLGSGSPVLFIHNGGTSKRIWREQCNALSPSHNTIAVDLPGFGDSPLASRKLEFSDYVSVVEELIKSLDLIPLVIVGNCMGANIGAAIASNHPEWVSGLVLINPLTEATFSAGQIGLLHKMDRWAPRATGVAKRISRKVVLPGIAARVALRFQVGSKGASEGIQNDPELIACGRRGEQLPALVDVLDDMGAYGDLDRNRPGSSIPICTIWGSQNRVLSPKAGERLNEVLNPDRSEVISGCGHLVMLEDPEAVTSIIEEFIANLGNVSKADSVAKAPKASA
ncbi:MAG TPA: alpha/beta hydrolase [Microthrixaceae bacterium]|nr:alpha/beta hydrolase [Microthrixaceae bacterium]